MIQWELDLLNWIHSFSSPTMDAVMLGITRSATMALVWMVIAFGLILVKKYRRAGLAVVLGVVIAYLLSDFLLKPMFARDRPCEFADFELLVTIPGSYSFPSGHTMNAFVAATLLTIMFGKWGIPALAYAGLVGISRMYLFVHWPTDVLGGMLFGIVLAFVVAAVLRRFGLFYESKGGAEAP